MGALIAGAWAVGLSPAAMREALGAIRLGRDVHRQPGIRELSQRNKPMARRYPARFGKAGVMTDGPGTRPASSPGQ